MMKNHLTQLPFLARTARAAGAGFKGWVNTLAGRRDRPRRAPAPRPPRAQRDEVEAMNVLGLLHLKCRGIACDYAQARHWFQKAAAAGSTAAMHKTRSSVKRYREADDNEKLKEIGNRHKRAKIASHIDCDDNSAKAARLIKKWRLSEDLVISARHTFFCEVHIDHSQKRSPLLNGAPPGGGTLCYAYYHGDASADFTNCPITDRWYVGGALPGVTRVPRGVKINVSSGDHKGTEVRFCFWHAPAGNDGRIVVQMANGLNAGGQPFVLFGDLNAEPRDLLRHLRHQLAAGVSILHPPGGTRISGRTLDYAVTNVPHFFHACRRLYDDKKNREIKQTTGSDHMIMVLELK